MSAILRADQSPMNALRWSLDLACGHSVWVTQKSKPKVGKDVPCPTCDSDLRERARALGARLARDIPAPYGIKEPKA